MGVGAEGEAAKVGLLLVRRKQVGEVRVMMAGDVREEGRLTNFCIAEEEDLDFRDLEGHVV